MENADDFATPLTPLEDVESNAAAYELPRSDRIYAMWNRHSEWSRRTMYYCHHRKVVGHDEKCPICAAYHDRIMALVSAFHLRFTNNPGGGEFSLRGLENCQISTYNEEEDYRRVVWWLGLAIHRGKIKLPEAT